MPRKIRYAVVGLGHIAQVAVLPAFRHARNSELAALVSGDPAKLRHLAKRYRIRLATDYDGYDDLLRSGAVDAVYIALPNDQHRDFAVRAARAGVHVLCEKPMALDEKECAAMIQAARRAKVKLMIAYRLHFDAANLEALKLARRGKLGNLRLFNSTFSMQVSEGNIRVKRARGGGPVYDIGIYCINAARALFQAEPVEVSAIAATDGGKRFREIDESVSATLRFPGARLASFVCSFGAADEGEYELVGTKGTLCLAPAYEYAEPLTLEVTEDGRTKSRTFPKRDQFAAELEYFSRCILEDRDPEPSGEEGLADVRIIRALDRSVATGRAVKLAPADRSRRPHPSQKIRRPPLRRPPKHFHAQSPHP